MRTETLTVIWPHAALLATNAERRMHYHQRSKLVHDIRAQVASVAAGITPFDNDLRVIVAARFQWPDRRVRDSNGWHPTVKASVDGLVDAGVLIKDDDRYVADTRIGADLDPNPALKGYARMVLTITETEG